MRRRRLSNSKDGITLVFNFFELLQYWYKTDDKKHFLPDAIAFLNRHTPPGKRIGLQIDFSKFKKV